MLSSPAPQLSIIVPIHNESGNIPVLMQEIADVLKNAKIAFEILAVNDCSTDNSEDQLILMQKSIAALRILSHGTNAGQSRAVRSGILAASGSFIATLDGDGQNAPQDIPLLFEKLQSAPHLAMIGGERQNRSDSPAKKRASRLANGFRKWLLQDQATDTGCGLKLFRRDAYLRLPYFDHNHRYLPALFLREGYKIDFAPVTARPRLHGTSNYGNFERGFVAIRDLIGVTWLRARFHSPGEIREIIPPKEPSHENNITKS